MRDRWETTICADAWDRLHTKYEEAGGEDADDHTLAEILRLEMIEVEG